MLHCHWYLALKCRSSPQIPLDSSGPETTARRTQAPVLEAPPWAWFLGAVPIRRT